MCNKIEHTNKEKISKNSDLQTEITYVEEPLESVTNIHKKTVILLKPKFIIMIIINELISSLYLAPEFQKLQGGKSKTNRLRLRPSTTQLQHRDFESLRYSQTEAQACNFP